MIQRAQRRPVKYRPKKHRPKKHRQRGFSLLELIVVIAIMATVTGVIIPRINFGGDKKQIQTEATRLAELFRRASDESIFKSAELGILFTDSDYQFLKLEGGNREGKWVQFESNMFRKREWPDGFEVELQVAGVPVVLEASEEVEFDEKTRPQVMVLSNGEIMPDFKIIIDKGILDDRWMVATGVDDLIELGIEGEAF